jgi:GTP-binding protein
MLEISSSVFVKSITQHSQKPELQLPEFAFIGRSNVGKSTLINALCNRKNLARISNTPGKTRLINYFMANDALYLVDLPGYGFAKVPHSEQEAWRKMITAYLADSAELKCLFLLMDGRHGIKENDYEMLQWLEHHQKIYRVIFTKTDKLNQRDFLAAIKKSEKKFNVSLQNLYLPFSGKTKKGRERILFEIEQLLRPE